MIKIHTICTDTTPNRLFEIYGNGNMSSQEFNLRKADGAFLPTSSSHPSSLASCSFFDISCNTIRVHIDPSRICEQITNLIHLHMYTYHTTISTSNLIYDTKWAAKKRPMPYWLGQRIAAIAFHKLNPIFTHKLRIYRLVAITIATVEAFPNTHTHKSKRNATYLIGFKTNAQSPWQNLLHILLASRVCSNDS